MTLARNAFGRTFASLRRHRNYRLFFTGQLASVAGTWMQSVALYWLVISLTHSPLAVGLLSLARFGPFTVFGLFAGVVADRFDNRRIIMVTQTVQMTLSGVLAAITILGHVQTWQIYTIAMLTGTAAVFDLPTRQNLTIQLVGREELPNAIALNSSLMNATRIIGPALAGVVIAAVGPGWCFAINSASFLAVLASLLAMRVSELFHLEGLRRPTLFKGVGEALHHVRHTRVVLVLILTAMAVMSLSFNVNVMLPVLAKQTLSAGPQTFGIIVACFGAGALVGALVTATVGKPRLRFILGSVAVFGVAELAIAPLHQVVPVSALLFLCGICFSTFNASANSTVQLGTPDYLRGRVLGVYYYSWTALLPLASPFIGWLMATGGTELAFVFGGVLAIAASAAGALALRSPAPVAVLEGEQELAPGTA
jgi:MFS family permease